MNELEIAFLNRLIGDGVIDASNISAWLLDKNEGCLLDKHGIVITIDEYLERTFGGAFEED